MATQPVTKITEEEYLRLERAAKYKSEYIGGEIFAMPGGSFKHSRLTVNWSTELSIGLRRGPCSVFSPDARVRTPSTGSYVYPDVSVVCGEPIAYAGSDDILTNPIVVVEVLSPSTSNYDRGEKFELYREIPSLKEYVLVHTTAIRVEHFARQADGSWIFREYQGEDSAILLDSIQCTVRLGEVYSDLPAESHPASATI
jgi:Uma2 family endonuclease